MFSNLINDYYIYATDLIRMTKLYKLIVLIFMLIAMNKSVQAQERTINAISSVSKAFIQEVAFSNYPNPASSHTTVSYNLTTNAKVNLKVLVLTGRQLAVLVNLEQSAGKQEYYWDFKRNKITSGMYILMLRINNNTYSRKVIVQ